MDGLFDHTSDFDGEFLRNIVSLRKTQNLFDDLIESEEENATLIEAEIRIKGDIGQGVIARGFHYSTAIEYPFHTEPFMASRYGDGTYPVWYGSLTLDTTIYETAWHMMDELSGIEGLNETVIRERAVYRVECRALLFDLTKKKEQYASLIADDCGFTQQVGRRIQGEGHPGLLVPSVRENDGVNGVVFKEDVLRNPKLSCYLTYKFDAEQKTMLVERDPGVTYINWHYS